MKSLEMVSYWYHKFLRREPDSNGEQYWINRLAMGEDPNKLLSEFLALDEYWSLSGGTPISFIRQLTVDIHNHLPEDSLAASLAQSLATGLLTRQEVAYKIITSAYLVTQRSPCPPYPTP